MFLKYAFYVNIFLSQVKTVVKVSPMTNFSD